jgi:hypothetical protein
MFDEFKKPKHYGPGPSFIKGVWIGSVAGSEFISFFSIFSLFISREKELIMMISYLVGITEIIAMYPLDLVKTRLQLQTYNVNFPIPQEEGIYIHFRDALKKIFTTEG